MDQHQPTWRVFDAPAEPAGSPAGGRLAASAEQGHSFGVTPTVAAGIVAATAIAALAVVVALGGLPPSGSAATGPTDGPGASVGAVGGVGGGGGEIVVDVAGAVARPGVYRLVAGSRVADAIAAAGGYSPRIAPDRVDAELNLAALVHDGERVLVPSRDSAASAPAGQGPGASAALIDINRATEAQLDSLPGIGPVTAGKIVVSREQSPFKRIGDLLDRKLVGQKTFDAIRSLISVG